MLESLKVYQYWLLLLTLTFTLNQATGQLMRLAEVNATICPGENVEYLCHVEQVGDTTTLSWSIGNVVLPSYVQVQGVINETVGEIQMSFQLPGVFANLTELTPSGFTSILYIESAGDSVDNQTIIQCSGTGLRESLLLSITSSSEVEEVEAPLYVGLELFNVTVLAQLCTETIICVDIPNTTITNNCQPCSSSPCTNTLPQRLNLCRSNYTITAYAMDSTIQASTIVGGDPNGYMNGVPALSEVANVQSSSSSLMWSPPANRPEDCVTGYEISWNGGSFIHSPSDENMPSVSFEELKRNRFPVCETVDVTISPFLPALGVLVDKAANFTGLVIPGTEGLPGLGYDGAIAISVIIPSLATFILGLVIGIAITFYCSNFRQQKTTITHEQSKDEEREQEQSMI